MSVGRFASAIVAGMVAGGLTAMSGIGRDQVAAPVVAPVATATLAAAAPAAVLALPKLTIVDPR